MSWIYELIFYINFWKFCADIISFFKDLIYLFLDRGEGREKEKEKNINVWLPLTSPLLGTWPATQAYVP